MKLARSTWCLAWAIILLNIQLRETMATPRRHLERFRGPSGLPSYVSPPPGSPPTGSLSSRPLFNQPSEIERVQLKSETKQPSNVIYLIETLDPKAINNISQVLARFKEAYNFSDNTAAGSFDINNKNKTFEILKEDLLNNTNNVVIPLTLTNTSLPGGGFRQSQRTSRNLMKAVKDLIENGEGKLKYSGALTSKQSLNLFGKVFQAVVHITYDNSPEGSAENPKMIEFRPSTEKELFELITGVHGVYEGSHELDNTPKKIRHTNHEGHGKSPSYECNDSNSHSCDSHNSDSSESENHSDSHKNSDSHDIENHSGKHPHGDSHGSDSHGSDSHGSDSHSSDSHSSDSSESHHSDHSHQSESRHSGSHHDCHSNYGDSESNDSNGSPCHQSGYSESDSHESGSDYSVSENANSYSDHSSGSYSDSSSGSNSNEGFAKDGLRVSDNSNENKKNITTSNSKIKSSSNNSTVNKVLGAGSDIVTNKYVGNKIGNFNEKNKNKESGGKEDFPPLTHVIPFINGSYIDDKHPNVGYYNIYDKPNLLFGNGDKFKIRNNNYLNWKVRLGNSSQGYSKIRNDYNKFDFAINNRVAINETISRTNNKFIEHFDEKKDRNEQDSTDQNKIDENLSGTSETGTKYRPHNEDRIQMKIPNEDTTHPNSEGNSDNSDENSSTSTNLSKTNKDLLEINNKHDNTVETNSAEKTGSESNDSNDGESGNKSTNTNVSKLENNSAEKTGSENNDSNDNEPGNKSTNNNVSKLENNSAEKTGSENDSNDGESGNKSTNTDVRKLENNSAEKTGSENNSNDGESGNKSTNTDVSKLENNSAEKTGSENDSNDGESGNKSTNTNVSKLENNSAEKTESENNDSNDDNLLNKSTPNNLNKSNSGSLERTNKYEDTAETNSAEKTGHTNDEGNNEDTGGYSTNVRQPQTKHGNDVSVETNSEERSGSGNVDSNDDEAENMSSKLKNSLKKITNKNNAHVEVKSEDKSGSGDDEESKNKNNSSYDNESNAIEESIEREQIPKYRPAGKNVYKRIALRKKVSGLKGGKSHAKNYVHKQGQRTDSFGVGTKVAGTGNLGDLSSLNNLSELKSHHRRPFIIRHKGWTHGITKGWRSVEKQNTQMSWNDRLRQLSKISKIYV